ncbi:MAG: hypothetical protein ACE5HC_15670, partial [Candidatus Binatia bacterium]
ASLYPSNLAIGDSRNPPKERLALELSCLSEGFIRDFFYGDFAEDFTMVDFTMHVGSDLTRENAKRMAEKNQQERGASPQ